MTTTCPKAAKWMCAKKKKKRVGTTLKLFNPNLLYPHLPAPPTQYVVFRRERDNSVSISRRKKIGSEPSHVLRENHLASRRFYYQPNRSTTAGVVHVCLGYAYYCCCCRAAAAAAVVRRCQAPSEKKGVFFFFSYISISLLAAYKFHIPTPRVHRTLQ